MKYTVTLDIEADEVWTEVESTALVHDLLRWLRPGIEIENESTVPVPTCHLLRIAIEPVKVVDPNAS